MKKIYRVYVLGGIPSDLKERIAKIHAAGILTSRNEGKNSHLLDLKLKNGKRK
jgi:hypothetical protein